MIQHTNSTLHSFSNVITAMNYMETVMKKSDTKHVVKDLENMHRRKVSKQLISSL